ncbi:homocysteine S-methyltransferase family protein [Pectinatus frisingensis]|uniref:homocysteine S-methyltransferase family protein n=1 Tax=Pectinatus frisingensis TaxID=865 RepID=UPI0018C4D33C|nr:homocysteine S-methyltransferase family protein [Pectinatus frisingensis]
MINLFDGAMGTILQSQGILQPSTCPELLNIKNSQAIIDIHKKYIAAGSTIIETNTFGANRIKLSHYGLENDIRLLNKAGVKNAKTAMQGHGKVAGAMGPLGRFIEPLGDISFDEVYDIYFEQAQALAEGGADYILIETCIDIQEMRAALLAAKAAAPLLPIFCQMSYSEDGRTVTGTDPQTAAITLTAMGADIIGANCSTGPEELIPIIKILSENTHCPISVQPNAGMPHLINKKTVFPMTPADMAKWAPMLIAAGATFIGGCCGTTPDHIAAINRSIKNIAEPIRHQQFPNDLVLTSRTKTVFIGSNFPTRLIGERINPTGRKKLAAEIKNQSFISVKKEAVEQTNAGADILDVNMGVGGINQSAAMEKAIKEIAQIVDVPLSIDTSDPAALEAGLKVYPGRALINSVSAEPDRLKKFLPLAKKYGAAILCLPLSDKGLPKTGRERIHIIKKIIAAAKQSGLHDNDFILDCLVMTIAAEKNAATEVLQALSLYRHELGYPSTMGLSNISFGLPNRALINSTFFAMCLANGLDAPIMNPYDESMKNTLTAAAALIGKDPNGRHYSMSVSQQDTPTTNKSVTTPTNVLQAIKHSIITGEKENVAAMVEQALKNGYTSNEITEKALTEAMNDVGKNFGAKKIFLPQVMLSAEAMREAFIKIKEVLPSAELTDKGTVVIATVKGDIHDLGKNIVAALLENNGFKLIDLGKDVDAEEIVRAAIKNDADIVGLCSLMTTTMLQIDKVIAALKKAGARAHVIVGGAVLTQEYADAAGADAYAQDGVVAVKIAKKLIISKTPMS